MDYNGARPQMINNPGIPSDDTTNFDDGNQTVGAELSPDKLAQLDRDRNAPPLDARLDQFGQPKQGERGDEAGSSESLGSSAAR